MAAVRSGDGRADEREAELREMPMGDLARELGQDLSLLVRQEVELATAEMRATGRRALPVLGLLSGAGVAALCALGALTAAIVLVLATFLDDWLAAGLTAAGFGVVAVALWLQGRERADEIGTPVPEETIEKIEEDVEWIGTRARSGRR